MSTVPAYTAIGAAVGDVLRGSAKSGAFQLDPKITYTGLTTSGMVVSLSAVSKSGKVEPVLKAAYASKKGYSADITLDAAGKVATSTSLTDVLLPGLTVSASAVLPDPSSATVACNYSLPYLNTKVVLGNLSAKPVVDVTASTGYKDVVVGVETGFDTAKNLVSKYNVAVGYHAPDFQLSVSVLDKLQSVKVGYAHNVSSSTRVGAEVLRKLDSGDTTVALGYAKALSSGALAKFRLDNAGLLTALYETRLASGEKVAGSIQVQATDFSKPVKYGFAVDLC